MTNRFVFVALFIWAFFIVASWSVTALSQEASINPVAIQEQKDAAAQHQLAVKYANGDGVPVDLKKAAYWFGKAAAQGYARSQYNLGMMYFRGDGVARHYREAASWFRKAADQGHVDAQRNLALLHVKGEGVPQSLQEAYYWMLLASASGQPDVIQLRNTLGTQLTADQRKRAQEEAKNWKPAP